MFACTMPANATSIDSGIASDTTTPPFRLPNSNSSTATTSSPPSTRLRVTVEMVRRTRSVRSYSGSTFTPAGSERWI